METITTQQLADRLGLSPVSVRRLCRDGLILDAHKGKGGVWLIHDSPVLSGSLPVPHWRPAHYRRHRPYPKGVRRLSALAKQAIAQAQAPAVSPDYRARIEAEVRAARLAIAVLEQ